MERKREQYSRFDGHNGLTFVWEPRGDWRAEKVRAHCEELGLVHGLDPFQGVPAAGRLRYFRLHGRAGYGYRYTKLDLQKLAGTVRGGPPCYVLFNNNSMLEDANRFQRLAAKVSRGARVRK